MGLGAWGEETAAEYLKSKGYGILERNFRCKTGEIDIIASSGKTLVFVEVKARRSLKYGLPCEAVNENKQLHIKSAAAFYVMKNKMADINQRIDVVEIFCSGGKAYIRHMENVC